jgi:RNA polymerase sigma-32 factor
MALDMGGEHSLSRRAMRAELLDAETELKLAYAWRDERDEEALHRLVTAYMRLAISMAAKFKRYGAPMNDLIQEAGLGLMKAADKFDPDRGVRFSTYAVWWIKASIQDYVMRNWSMVRTGSTSSQKSLFFNMRRVQARLEREALARGENLDKHQLRQMIATEVGVPLHDVEMMEGRLAGSDYSLNATQSVDDEGREWIDALEDDSDQAADKFDPDRGVRFSTYAVWWIKASIQDYVMRNWSMVRTGSTSSQKSLFFNMRRVQARLEREAMANGQSLDKHQLRQMIATEVGVPLHDVEMMEGRLAGSDYSLNATQSVDDEGREWIDALEDDSDQAADIVEDSHDREQLRDWLITAMQALNDRERFIVRERKLREEPRTLESLGTELGLSKERVRQLEAAAFAKMRKTLEAQSKEVRSFFAA